MKPFENSSGIGKNRNEALPRSYSHIDRILIFILFCLLLPFFFFGCWFFFCPPPPSPRQTGTGYSSYLVIPSLVTSTAARTELVDKGNVGEKREKNMAELSILHLPGPLHIDDPDVDPIKQSIRHSSIRNNQVISMTGVQHWSPIETSFPFIQHHFQNVSFRFILSLTWMVFFLLEKLQRPISSSII